MSYELSKADMDKAAQMHEDFINMRMTKFGETREQAEKVFHDICMALLPAALKKARAILKGVA
jgi:hypothetical protein